MRSLILLVLATGCGGAVETWDPWVWVDLDVATGAVIAPGLDGEPTLEVAISSPIPMDDRCTVAVSATTVGGAVVDLGTHSAPSGAEPLRLSWDGRDAEGRPVDPGPVQVAADLHCGRTLQGFGEAHTRVVRLGVQAIDFGGDGDDQVAIAWHKTDLSNRKVTPVPTDVPEWRRGGLEPGQAELDRENGGTRPAPEPWTDAFVPPWGAGTPADVSELNLPIAYVAGGTASIAMTPATTARSHAGHIVDVRGPAATHADLLPIRVVSEDLVAVGDAVWSPGTPAHFALEGLPDTLGQHELTLTWRYEAQVDGQWVPIPGHETTRHGLWVLAGDTAVPDGTRNGASPAVSWLGVLADVQPAVQGLPADDLEGVMDALRDQLHTDPWIIYNPGDSAYSSFDGRYIFWDRIWVEMSDFLDRQQGIDLYCHSVACVLSSQANHLGIEAEYITLTHEDRADGGSAVFRTWLTRAAGSERWRQWSFNSHGIVEMDGNVWDAAVDIDIDDFPGAEPVEAWSPKGVTFEEYQEILSVHRLVVVNRGHCDVY